MKTFHKVNTPMYSGYLVSAFFGDVCCTSLPSLKKMVPLHVSTHTWRKCPQIIIIRERKKMTLDKMHPIVWIYHQEGWPCTLLWNDLVNQWRKWTSLINMIQRKTIRKGEEPLMAWELSLKALSFWSQVISIYTNEFKRRNFCGYENFTLGRF